MARYSTSTSIYTMLPGLPNTTTTTTLIQQHADRISGTIEGYVGRWYAVSAWTSASTTPQIIQDISDAITAQKTMRSIFTKDAQNRNDWVNDLAEQAVDDLKAINEQKLMVFDSTGAEASRQPSGAFVSSTRGTYTPIFDLDSDTSWGTDSDLRDQIESERS